MPYTYAVIEAQVRANVNDTSAAVTQEIDDAVNLLSNFFHQKKIDSSLSTVVDQAYITRPTTALEIVRVKIGDDEYNEVKISDLAAAETNEEKKWYDWDGKIQIIPTPSAVSTCKIWTRAGFTPMAGAGSTDVPDRLVPLLVVLATWLYYVQMVSKAISARELYPDVKPNEIEAIQKNWKKAFDELLNSIKNQKL